jgi:PAS domain-containing protein
MSRLDVQFLDQGLHRVMFDAMPMPVFVVDRDVTILEFNSAAAQMLHSNKRKVLQRRAGEVLHCVHSDETPGGCGRSWFCSDCVVRNSVLAAWHGSKVVRQTTTLELHSRGRTRKVDVKISTNPFKFGEQSYVLLVLEGLNDKPLPAART